MNKLLLFFATLLGIVAVLEAKRNECPEYTDDEADLLFDKDIDMLKEQWKQLKTKGKKNDKKWKNEAAEVAHRRNLFRKRAKAISKINKRNGGTFCLRLNKFATMDDDELNAYLGGPKRGSKPDNANGASGSGRRLAKRSAPTTTSLFYPSGDVGDQGACSSCSMWSSLHTLNGFLTKANGKVTELSEKQLIDCYTWNGAEYNCEPVWPYTVYDYFKTHLPVEKHAYANYTVPAAECGAPPASGQLVASWLRLDSAVTDERLMHMLQTGPVVTALDCSNELFFYASGILDKSSSETCGGSHAVTVVGYGSEDGVDYFIAKNSWGYKWGERGYFRVRRLGGAAAEADRFCHWGWLAAQPTLADGAQPQGYDAGRVAASAQRLPDYVGNTTGGEQPTACCATVFEDEHFGGKSKEFCGNSHWVGVQWEHVVSSLKVDDGCKATIYQYSIHSGAAYGTFEGSVPTVGRMINDDVFAIDVDPQ